MCCARDVYSLLPCFIHNVGHICRFFYTVVYQLSNSNRLQITVSEDEVMVAIEVHWTVHVDKSRHFWY